MSRGSSKSRLAEGYQFFSGQIVALRGSNTFPGESLAVKEVLDVPLLPSAASSPEKLRSSPRPSLRGVPDAIGLRLGPPLPLTILFASGPYTADDNLDFEAPPHPLRPRGRHLCRRGRSYRPFIDSEHPMITSGRRPDLPEDMTCDATTRRQLATVFRYLISPALRKLAVTANPHVTILLVPSVRDVVDKLPPPGHKDAFLDVQGPRPPQDGQDSNT